MTGSDRAADAGQGGGECAPSGVAGQDMLAAGVVTGTHGVGGDLKLKVFSGNAEHLRGLHEAVFRGDRGEKTLRLSSVRPQANGAILRVEDVVTVEQARRLVGYEMWVPRAQAAPLGDGEYYTADLCRCRLL
ncbi:MAG TPA: ribosome maturation factor RimM, partial [Spirochaetia bacterium]